MTLFPKIYRAKGIPAMVMPYRQWKWGGGMTENSQVLNRRWKARNQVMCQRYSIQSPPMAKLTIMTVSLLH